MEKREVDLRYIIALIADMIKNKELLSIGYEVVKIFDTDPWDFLSFCRQDLDDDSERGRTNALSNAKRAIECRVDEILILVNLKHFASKNRWGLPYKLQVLKTFDISAPDVLISYITSKRNILEHEYVKPKAIEEIQHIADITELFLRASDYICKKGYLVSVEFENEKKLEKEPITKWKDKWLSYVDKYMIRFDLEKELMVFNHKQFEASNEFNKRTSELSSREKMISEETSEILLNDCKEIEIKELMKLLIES